MNDFSRAAQPATPQVLRSLDQAITHQAQLVSYIDVFWLLAIIAALTVPVTLLLLRRVKPGAAAAGH